MKITDINSLALSPELIKVKSIIDEVLTIMRFAPDYSEIQVIVDINPKHHVYTDKKIIKTLLTNLLATAFKNDRKDKTQLLIESRQETNLLYISIIDNDKFKSIEKQKSFYEMFNNATEFSKGIDSSFHKIKTAVSKIKGQIYVQFIPDQGCHVKIILPDLKTT